MVNSKNNRIGGKRLLLMLSLVALALMLAISAGSVLAGRLTDTTAGLKGAPAKAVRSSGSTNQRLPAAQSAPGAPSQNDAFVYFSDPATATFPGEPIVGP